MRKRSPLAIAELGWIEQIVVEFDPNESIRVAAEITGALSRVTRAHGYAGVRDDRTGLARFVGIAFQERCPRCSTKRLP